MTDFKALRDELAERFSEVEGENVNRLYQGVLNGFAFWLLEHQATILAALDLADKASGLQKAAIDLRDDLLERAEWDGDAKVVVAGAGAWFRFCQALQGDDNGQG